MIIFYYGYPDNVIFSIKLIVLALIYFILIVYFKIRWILFLEKLNIVKKTDAVYNH